MKLAVGASSEAHRQVCERSSGGLGVAVAPGEDRGQALAQLGLEPRRNVVRNQAGDGGEAQIEARDQHARAHGEDQGPPARRANIRVWFRSNGGESKIYYRRFQTADFGRAVRDPERGRSGLKFLCSSLRILMVWRANTSTDAGFEPARTMHLRTDMKRLVYLAFAMLLSGCGSVSGNGDGGGHSGSTGTGQGGATAGTTGSAGNAGAPGRTGGNAGAGTAGSAGGSTGGGGRGGGGTTGAGGGVAGTTGTAGRGGATGTPGTGGVGGGAGEGGGVSGSAGGSARFSCQQPVPVQVTSGVQTSLGDTGLDRCQSGAIHRRAVVAACPWLPPSASMGCSVSCQSDADCVQRPLGVCAQAHQLGGYCGCFYGFCEKDADCGAGSICLCGGPVGGTCVPATCMSDAGCPAGFLCASSSSSCGGGRSAFACQSAADECLGDGDCPINDLCVLQAGKRSCVPNCIPRP